MKLGIKMSLITSFRQPPMIGLPTNHENKSTANQVGNHIGHKVTTLVVGLKLLNDMTTFAAKKGTKAVCAFTTLSGAFSALMSGNIPSAMIMGVSGLKETYDLLMKDGSLQKIQELLKDNQAGLEITNEILNFNQVVLNQATEGVSSIGKSLSSINQDLYKLQQTSDEGRQIIVEGKKEVVQLYVSADKAYKKAEKYYLMSQSYAKEADEYFNKTMEGFNKIFEAAHTEGAQISDILRMAEKMQKHCEKAQRKLHVCMQYQELAIKKTEAANETYRSASFKSGEVLGKAAKIVEEISDVTTQAQKQVKAAQEEQQKLVKNVQDLRDNNEALLKVNTKLLDNNKQMVTEAENMAEHFGFASMILGGVPGALAGQLIGGTPGLAVGLMAGAKVAHHRNKIARKVADWLFGIKKESSVSFAPGQKIASKFDDHSSGFYGRYLKKRESKTVGTLAIKVGHEQVFEMRFNVKGKNLVKDADLKTLKDILEQKVNSQEMSSEECLEIIHSLEKMRVGSRAVMPENEPFFLLFKQSLAKAA